MPKNVILPSLLGNISNCIVVLIRLFFYNSNSCFVSKSLLNVKFFVVQLFFFSVALPISIFGKMFCYKYFPTKSKDPQDLETVVTELIKVLFQIHPEQKVMRPTF